MGSRFARLSRQLPFRLGALFLVSLVFLMTAALSARAAEPPPFWTRWTAHVADSKLVIDHSGWTEFLQKYVSTDAAGVNRVAYGRVAKNDRRALDGYISRLTLAPLATYPRSEQLAFWINLYNAVTLQTVLNHYPVASIRDIAISPGWFTQGPWEKKLVVVEGIPLSLDDIEHRILRPIWKDARLHYALNCASVGCPNLRREAYTGARADEMLNEAARAYVNDPRGVAFAGADLEVSSIYKWYVEDFGGNRWGVLAHLRKYAAQDLRERLGSVEAIDGYRYDWSLNDEKPSSGPSVASEPKISGH